MAQEQPAAEGRAHADQEGGRAEGCPETPCEARGPREDRTRGGEEGDGQGGDGEERRRCQEDGGTLGAPRVVGNDQ